MTDNETALARVEPFSLVPATLTEAVEYAKMIAQSGLCPKQFAGKPADVMIAVQMGAELGVSPIQALQNVAVINGRPCIWGDLVVALVQKSGQLEYLREEWDRESQTATVTIKRKGFPEHVETFSMEDARQAKLAGKDTYQQFPQRMCGWRAKTWAIRSEFADVLKGFAIAEEEQDRIIETTATEVPMPRRASDVRPGDGEKALKELGAGPVQPQAKPPATAPRREAPSHSGGESGGPPYVDATVTDVTEKSGKKANGGTWTLWTVKTGEGDFGTFDRKIADMARASKGTGQLLRIVYSATDKGNRNIVELTSAPADEPGADFEE